MEASVITIGDEILIGQVVDTNSAFIGQQLSSIGIHVSRILSVQDKEREIVHALQHCGQESGLVLVTGGLGPTSDDITKPAICSFFDTSLVMDDLVLEHLEKLLAARGVAMNEKNRQQALVPALAQVVHNRTGTAPALWLEKDATVFIFMPGVPFEMKTIITEEVLPRLKSRYSLPVILHKTVLTQGIAESHLSEKLSVFEAELPAMISLAYLPSPGLVRLRLTGRSDDRDTLVPLMESQVHKLETILGRAIYGYDNDRLEEVTGKLLVQKGKQLATAESCTGGAIAAAITSVPGSSRYYKGSIVAYSNEIKIKVLGVDPLLIEKYGAVSREVVSAMAEGVLRITGADFSIASSGIAGPDGGTPEKPVGTTWIAVSDGRHTEAILYNFGEDRGRTVTRAVHAALNQFRLFID
ncbi:MAG: competence/damage-inducible protein A [Bacteroidales bacterium]